MWLYKIGNEGLGRHIRSIPFCCTLFSQSLCVSIYRRTGELPLVTGWLPFIGITLDYVAKPLGFLRKTQKKYGNVFTCKIAGKYFTFVTDPFSFSIVMRQSKNLDFQKFAVGFSHRVSDSIRGGGALWNKPGSRECCVLISRGYSLNVNFYLFKKNEQ